MTGFRMMPLEDVCQTVNSGGTPSRREPSFWEGGTIPWIKTGELNDWKVTSIGEHITEAGLKGSSAKLYSKGTILIAMYGDGKTITTMGLIDRPAATNQACCGIVANPDECDPLFLFYALKHRRSELLNLVVAGAQRNLSVGTIRRFPVPVPPLETQRRIASILGAYDDLIEVNRRRIAVLEEMARGLFEEWFVRFGFPGREAVPILDTPNGPLPEGWSWTPLAKLAKFKSGNNKLTKAAYKGDGIIAYSASGPDGFVEHAEGYGPAVIVSAVGAYCGKSWLANGDWTAIANTFALLPYQGVPAEFLFLAMYGIEKWPRRGAAQPFIAKTDAGAKTLPHPPQEIWTLFAQHVRPIFNLIRAINASSRNLAASRDLLLPRLISGQLSVRDAERELEEAV